MEQSVLDDFRQALERLVMQKNVTYKAMQQAKTTPEGSKRQLRFLALCKRTDLTPVEGYDEDGNPSLLGIAFNDNGKTHTIDFTNPEHEPFKNAFTNAYMDMEIDALVVQTKEPVLTISKATNQYTISGRDYLNDALDKDTLQLTMHLAKRLHEHNPEMKINVFTEKKLDIDMNPHGSRAGISAKERYMPSQSYDIMHIGKNDTPPVNRIISEPHTEWLTKSKMLRSPRYNTLTQPPTQNTTIDIDQLADYIAEKSNENGLYHSQQTKASSQAKSNNEIHADVIMSDIRANSNNPTYIKKLLERHQIRQGTYENEILDALRRMIQDAPESIDGIYRYGHMAKPDDALTMCMSGYESKDRKLRFIPIPQTKKDPFTEKGIGSIAAIDIQTGKLLDVLPTSSKEAVTDYNRLRTRFGMAPQPEYEAPKPVTRTYLPAEPDNQETELLHEAFRKHLEEMAANPDILHPAIRKVANSKQHDNIMDDSIMRRVMLDYDDPGMQPLECAYTNNSLGMLGLTFRHPSGTKTIRFDEPAHEWYKSEFEKMYLQETANALVWNAKNPVLDITHDGNDYLIKKGRTNKAREPLDQRFISLTTQCAWDIKAKNPDASITVETELALYTQTNKADHKTKIYTGYKCFDDSCYNPSETCQKDNTLFTIGTDKKNVPFDRLSSPIDKYARPSDIKARITMLDLNKIAARNMDYDGPEDDAGIKTNKEQVDAYIEKAKKAKARSLNAQRTKTFDFLSKYGMEAKSPSQGIGLCNDHGIKPDTRKKTILSCMACMEKRMNPHTHSGESTAQSMKGYKYEAAELAYYPIYNRTVPKGNPERDETLALAAVSTRTWEVKGILRMDDPEALPIYNRMREKTGKPPILVNQNRNIPASQRPDFMQNTMQYTTDMQYE